MDPNLAFRLVPTVVTAVMITTAISPAMRPYSMAVAPDSHPRKARMVFIRFLPRVKRARRAGRRFEHTQLRLVEIVVNLVFRRVPMAVTDVMITTAIKPAIRPYSMAVAPDWSFRKREIIVIVLLLVTL